MANYTKSVDFAAKDGLAPGSAGKRILGTEINTEFNNISTAISSKLDSSAFVVTTPVGSIVMWPTSSAPAGWLIADGSAVSRTTYATLFGVLGTTFGAGDGATTFNLPNYVNRFAVGAGSTYAAGATGGSANAIVVSHSHTASAASSATSTVTDPGHNHNSTITRDVWRGANAGNVSAAWGGGDRRDATSVSHTVTSTSQTTGITVGTSVSTSVTVDSQGSSGTNANLPPYLGIFFIIKA